jgi:hypothetical protein
MVYSSTLAEHSVGLDSLGFGGDRDNEAPGERYVIGGLESGGRGD